MEINESISISQSPKKIWDFWLLVSTDAQWRSGVLKAEWTSQPPYGLGSTGVHYVKNLGTMSWEVTKWEDGRFFRFVHRGGKFKGSVASYHVEPEKNGSRVTIRAKMVFPSFMRILMIFIKSIIIKGIKTDLQKLKELMEKQEQQST